MTVSQAERAASRPGVARRVIALLLNLILPPFVLGVAWGGVRDFLSSPVRVLGMVLFILPNLAMIAFTTGYSSHERRSSESRGFVVALNLSANLSLIVAVALEGHGIWVLPGGDALGWAGVAILALGTFIRIGTMLELGRRFSLTVSAQENHRLQTTGFYARVRHPSYLGVLLISIGVAGVFRSGLWLALIPIMAYGLRRRIGTEERFLLAEFGEEYRAYMARTARLVPGIY